MGNTIRQKLCPKGNDKKDQYIPIPKEENSVKFEGSNGKDYFFLLADVIIEVREFSYLSVKDQSVKFRGKLTIKLPSLPPEVKDCIQEKLKISLFHNQKVVTLGNGGAKRKVEKGVVIFIYHIDQIVSWTPDLTYLPFDSQRIPICVELLHFKIGSSRYYFNITNDDNPNEIAYSFSKKVHIQGLADFTLYSYVSRYEKNGKVIAKKRVQYCPQITVYFSLARLPLNYYLTVLLPNFILQLLSLIIFGSRNNFGDRVLRITTLILAIVSFLPTVRAKLPDIPYVTLMDFIIYIAVVNVGFCTLDTVLKKWDSDYESDVWLILACCLVFLCTLISGVFLAWKIIQYFLMKRRARERKRVTEKAVVKGMEDAEKKATEDQDGRQMHPEIKEMEAVEVGIGAVAGAVTAAAAGDIKKDGELHKGKSLIPSERRYADREAQVRFETGKGVAFSKIDTNIKGED